jgi:Domain of unknown function (DUF4136)
VSQGNRPVLTCMFVGCCCLLAAAALLAQQVQTNYMPGTDFSKYKTYHWTAVEGGGIHPNQIVDAEIKEAVDKQLAEKGFNKTDDHQADLAVTYQVAVDKERQWNGMGMGGGPRWGGMTTATSTTISVGTIVLDFYDAGAKQLVWQGHATKAIDPGSNQEKNQKNLDKAMKKLLKDFPPKKK